MKKPVLLRRGTGRGSLRPRREMGDMSFTAQALDGLARVAVVLQRHADAQVYFAESLNLRHEAGEAAFVAHSLE